MRIVFDRWLSIYNKPVKSHMVVKVIYTSWSGYLEGNHVTDLNARDVVN